MVIFKYALMAALVIKIFSVGVCDAKNTADYANMLLGGTYYIDCTISSDYECANAKVKKSEKLKIAQNGSGDFLFEKNTYCPNSEYQYVFYKVLSFGTEKFRSFENSKNKEIDVQKVKLLRVKPGSKSDLEIYNSIKDRSDTDTDILFSVLGGISKIANVLPNYEVEIISCKNEELNGLLYNVEEYAIKTPYNANLKLYYLNGELVKCIKLLNATMFSNKYFSDVKSPATGYIVADIHRFDNGVDVSIFSLPNKK